MSWIEYQVKYSLNSLVNWAWSESQVVLFRLVQFYHQVSAAGPYGFMFLLAPTTSSDTHLKEANTLR